MYEPNAFFWYKAVFAVELMFAEWLMCVSLRRRSRFALRSLLSVAACIGVSFALPTSSNALFSSLIFIVIFGATLVAMKVCFAEEWKKIVFCGMAGYTTQHVAYQIFGLSIALMGLVGDGANHYQPSVSSNPIVWLPIFNYGSGQEQITGNPFILLYYLFVFGITYFAAYKFAAPRIKNSDNMRMKSTTLLFLVAVILLFDVIVSAMVTEYSSDRFDKFYVIITDVTNVFCCLLAMYLQFSVALVRKLEDDLTAITRIRREEKLQYALIKENINMINIKCHDLKHQIRRIGAVGSVDKRTISEIEKAVSIYDSEVKTNNEALDVILTEKSLYCTNNNIVLSSIADGKLLSFMNETDIYSLFGNLLDNAIEAVKKLDKDKRVIGLTVKRMKSLVFINVYNAFDGKILFADKLPVTTKADRENHGYGMKSVRMTVEKYGGEMNITTKNNVFSISVVFDRSRDEEKQEA